ncbi:ATP-binding protein [Chloroflexota bacterium]
MKLRTKVLAIIGVVIVSLVAILYTTSQNVIFTSFNSLEEQNTQQNVERAASALGNQILALDGVIQAGAGLDDTYHLAKNPSPENQYIFQSLSQNALGSVALDFLLIVNTSGDIVYAMGYDDEKQEVVPIPSSLEEHLSADSNLIHHLDAESKVNGILLLDEGPIIVGSRPISGGEQEESIVGAMVGGRFLRDAEIQELSALTQLPLSMVQYQATDMPTDFGSISANLSQEEPLFIEALSEDSIAGYTLLSDIYENPALVMRAEMHRDIYQQGQASSRYLMWALIGIGGVFFLLTLVLMEKFILSRLTRLSKSVAAVGESGNISARVPVAGRDELSRLGEDINGMLSALERSIQEKEKAEAETAKIEQQLQLAGRLAAVGELAAGVAHELNNPLAAVQAFAQFLADREGLDEDIKNDVDTIYRESQRASKITSNLLSFARKHNPEKSLISINEVIEKSLELHLYRMKVSNIEVVKDLDPELPITMADYYQMQQVFANIITNAEQAMTKAHGKGKLTITSQSVGELIEVTFADDGPGMTEDNLKRLFDPFFTTKEVGEGTGLGLSICYGIVKEHSGRIYSESKVDEGMTFVVEIPVVSDVSSVEETNSAHYLQPIPRYM